MPPKRTRNALPARQQMLFQATRPAHKARSSASGASRPGKGKARASVETPAPSSSLPEEIDLVDLRSSSTAPQDGEDESDDIELEVDSASSSSPRSVSPADIKAQATPPWRSQPRRAASSAPISGSKHSAAVLKSVEDLPDLKVDDPAFDEYWSTAKKRLRSDKTKPVHVEEEDRVQIMLRVFDMDPAYGPSMGMTRLVRWHRAHELGLDPPEGVRAMLETKRGQLELNQSVLDRRLF